MPWATAIKYEAGGAAVLGSLWPQPLEYEADGSLDLKKVAAAHQARRRPLRQDPAAGAGEHPERPGPAALLYRGGGARFARRKGLAIHLDGARVFNAAVKLGVPVKRDHPALRQRVPVPVQGPGRAGGLGAGRHEGLHRPRPPHPQDAGRRHAPGRRAGRGLPVCASSTTWSASPRTTPTRKVLAEGLAGMPGLTLDPKLVQTNMLFASMVDPARVDAARGAPQEGRAS